MLPHLKGRPTSLVRGPSGIGGQLFFQKHVDTLRIPGINELDPSFLPGHPPMLEIATATALVQAAQLNVIEFHTWNATIKSIENPDRILFDLDPGEGVQWQQVVEGTMLTKAFLDELKLKSFLKTSGGKGLHVVVPISPVANWDEIKDFSEAIVVHLARTVPQRFVAKSGPKNRVGKIFIDYLRNTRGATTAAAFSARARPGTRRLDAAGLGRARRLEERKSVEHHKRAQPPAKNSESIRGRITAYTSDNQTRGAKTFGRLRRNRWQPH